MCGEKEAAALSEVYETGSPPRVRGKAFLRFLSRSLSRITPACAGKRGGRTVSFFLIRDHPRVCGEKARTLIAWEEPQGSPPRVRGKESNAKTGQKARRITPACAGKRATPSKNPHPGGDHPRVCGEKYTCAAVRACRLGSPPRVRGKVARRGLAFSGFGITPACAGKSSSAKMQPTTRWDHPRVCGEKSLLMKLMCFMVGSPPRVRGKAVVCLSVEADEGITPACAGKRTDELFCVRVVRDHPRVCGEKLWHPRRRKTASGSPPRVRGKGRCGRVRQPERGITPACAGKSEWATLPSGRVKDHPRVCGEKPHSGTTGRLL